MTDWNAVSAFMASVVPWPGTQQDPGYINLQNSYVDRKSPDGKRGGKWPVSSGKPFQTVGDLISRAAWITTASQMKDVWYCLSLQSTVKPDPHNPGKLKAVRAAANALKVKAIWIDIDVGDDPKKYPTINAALAAIIEFREKVGLPPFSAIVFSGSGIHVYWISDAPLTPAEWTPYARGLKSLLLQHGVKCDAGLTTDIARILRVPGTFNHKTTPPKPVKLSPVPLTLYNFEQRLGFLTGIAPQAGATPGVIKPQHVLFAEGANMDSFKAGPIFKIDEPDLNAGINKLKDTLLDPRPIFTECGFYREALRNGGADYNQELWMYSILGSTFMENGKVIAHEISKGHPTYSLDDTEAMYNRKLAERHERGLGERGLGYPQCSTIQGAGCKSCTTCPLLAKGKSPLNMRPVVTATVTNTSSPSSSSGQAPGQPASPPEKRKSLHGGIFSSDDEALELLNSHYLIGKSEHEVAIFRIKDDGSLAFAPLEQFKLDVGNIFVQPSGGSGKPIPVEKFWREHPCRHQRTIVFKPGGTTEPHEFNLWRGFGVEPYNGWRRQRRLLRHIWEIICRRDKAKFRYFIRWLAWAVQNPDKHSEVVVVLKSRKQGTGKSTVGAVMLKIFGAHGALVDDKDRLLGRFNDWLETTSFVLGEEIMWAGDPRSTDKLKSMITANTIQVERKNGAIRQITNRLHPMMTTNHDHAVAAGVGDRRNVILDVGDERASDKTWFDPLYLDLEAGGASEFLWLLQNLRLGDWHPRQIIKTAEATEQQRMSADTVSQWSRACIDADAIVGNPQGSYAATHDLGTKVTSEALREAYTGYCKQQNLRAVNGTSFGVACTEMFGPRKRLKAQQNSKRRPYGYDVPTGNRWQRKLDERLGIKK